MLTLLLQITWVVTCEAVSEAEQKLKIVQLSFAYLYFAYRFSNKSIWYAKDLHVHFALRIHTSTSDIFIGFFFLLGYHYYSK
jgi:hypothetical protein